MPLPTDHGSTNVWGAQLNAQILADEAALAALQAVVPNSAFLDARFGTVNAAPWTHLKAWAYNQSWAWTSATVNANNAITVGTVTWPDGNTGSYTADTLSSTFLGATDAWHVTWVNGAVTKTITQAAVTRNASGAITAQPALVVT